MEELGTSDTDEHIGETVCICGKIDELTASDIDKYHCPRCEPICGPSIMKVETNWHRHDKTDPQATYKPLQVGTKLFVDELSKRIFSSADDIIMKVSGKQLTLPYLNQSGFNNPILVTDKDGLSMTTPQPGFNMNKICQYLGEDFLLDVIDVQRQQACQMSVGQFGQSFNNPQCERVLNCLSLEVSDTSMSDLFSPPLVARKLCWVNNVWPSVSNLPYPKPQVQKYCIMSMGRSYTDFHIDFGGTSVWYHIYEGEKYFYFIRPTPANISLYERWTRLTTQTETFLGDMVDRCYLLKLTAGQTVFIPTGWIHAVYTPVRSIVFGGNFLHSLNIQLQLRIYELENRLKDPPKFRFPSFEVVHWLAAGKLKKDLADLNSDNTPCPINLLNGIRSLVTTLKSWITDVNRPAVNALDCSSILKDLNREVKNAERISLKINPPKPERESNRRRKKKNLDEDFIDPSDPSSLYLLDYDSQHSQGSKKQRPKQEKVIAIKSKPVDAVAYPDHQFQQHQPMSVQGYNPAGGSGGYSQPGYNPAGYSTQPLPGYHHLNPGAGYPAHHLPQEPAHLNSLPPFQQSGPAVVTSYINQPQEHPISPVKLSLSSSKESQYQDGAIIDNRGEIPISKRAEESKFAGYDLTDRDAVRELLTTGKGADLNNALNDALTDFGVETNHLVIDEKPRKGARKSIKLRLSVGSTDSSATPVNQGAAGQPETYPQLDSPTTREAVAGMLSMSKAKLHPKMAVKASLKKKIKTATSRLKEEKINRVHQDEDFIYPTLDMSDDEDIPTRTDDEAWNPKVKMSNVGPKKDRPVRESVKNIAIEKGLKKAAENRTSFSGGRRSSASIIKKRLSEKKASPGTGGGGSGGGSGGGGGGVKSPNFFDDRSRSRKVCTTAKQRLGKILGLKF